MYTIKYKKSAQKALQSMPSKVAAKFIEAFEMLAANPASKALDIKPLKGEGSLYRLRMGSWRAIYEIENSQLIIYVVKIGPRGDVYK